MKRTTRLFPTSILIAVFLLSACAPTVPSTTSAPESVPPTQTEAAAPTVPAATQPEVQPEATLAPTETPPQIIATSRGPDLEATDPTTVNLASGQLQLVEFFRFTWGTCRAMAPMVHGLEATYYGKVQFTYLDADDSRTQGFQRALGFRYQPEFYLLDANGNLLKKFIGFVSQAEFEAAFAQYLP